MDFASNGFVLICAALVFIMTPGLALFYGGLARKKNVIDTMMASVGNMGYSIKSIRITRWHFIIYLSYYICNLPDDVRYDYTSRCNRWWCR